MPPPELVGSNYRPGEYYHNEDLSDWSRLSQLKYTHDITAIRVYGFSRVDMAKDPESTVDIEIIYDDLPEKYKLASGGIAFYRPPVGDYQQGSQMYGEGAHIGVVSFILKGGKQIIIGVNKYGFILGRYHGTSRQTFYSNGLAVFVDKLLQLQGHRPFPEVLLRQLSPVNGKRQSPYNE